MSSRTRHVPVAHPLREHRLPRQGSLRFGTWFLLALLCAALPLWGQTPHFTRRVWSAPDGLPEPIVQVVGQDRDGFLLVGTSGGLTRFDGARFLPVAAPAIPGSESFPYYCMLIAHDGSIWAGSEGEGLFHFWNGGARRYGAESGLMDSFVRALVEDAQGRIWAGTDNGLFAMREDRFERIDHLPGGPIAVAAIALDDRHRVWAGGSSLIVVEGDLVKQIKLPGAYSQNRVKALLQARDGTIWAGTVGGLLRQTDHAFQTVPGITATVRSLTQTTDGMIWIGTIGEGIWGEQNGALRRLDRKGMLPSETVLSLFEDASRRIWVGTQSGLVRLEPTSVEVVPLPNGAEADYGTVSEAGPDSSWMVVQNLFRVRSHLAAQVTLPGIPGTGLRNVLQARDGSLWVGTDGQGAFHRSTSGAILHLLAPRDLTNNFIRVFLEASDHSLWIGTDEGVTHRLPNGEHTSFGVADGLAQFSIRDLFEDRQGSVWIGTDKGLSHWQNGALVHDMVTSQLSTEKIWAILQDRQGALWFGTRDHGLYRYRDGRLLHYTVEQGLASNSVYAVLQDHKGTFWLSAPDSISSLSEASMDGDYPAGKPLAATRYQLPYEADGAQVYGGRESSGYVAADNTVWFPTNHGAVHVLDLPRIVTPAPVVRIESISSDGQKLTAAQGAIVIPARTARLDIAFAPLMLGSQRGVRFRYMLEGFDRTWISASAAHSATYTNLPPGRFRFLVVAFDASHPEATSFTSVEIVKDRFFYQTGWFRGGCVCLALGVVFLGYRIHMRRIQAGFDATHKERGRIAREMHDTVIQGCNGVSVLLEAYASQHGPEAENDTLLRHARSQIIATVKEARDVIWNLRHEEKIDLSTSLERLTLQASQALGLPVVFSAPVPPGMVSHLAGHEVLMIAREALANSASHGAPRCVQVALSFRDDVWTLQVSDDGAGFRTEAVQDASRHYGLAGMRERAERIGGKLTLRTSPGQGTDVCLRISTSNLLRASSRRSKA